MNMKLVMEWDYEDIEEETYRTCDAAEAAIDAAQADKWANRITAAQAAGDKEAAAFATEMWRVNK